jgi:hypothetical protein
MANEKRLIDLDKAVEKLEFETETKCEPIAEGDSFFEKFKKRLIPKLLRNVIDWLQNQPTVDAVEVVHGRWIGIGGNRYTRVSQCSNCCAKYDFMSNYCPNCGAKMDGERKDNEKKAD